MGRTRCVILPRGALEEAEALGGKGGWGGGRRACGAGCVMMILNRSVYDDDWMPCVPFFFFFFVLRGRGCWVFATVAGACVVLVVQDCVVTFCRQGVVFGRCEKEI